MCTLASIRITVIRVFDKTGIISNISFLALQKVNNFKGLSNYIQHTKTIVLIHYKLKIKIDFQASLRQLTC